MNQKAPHLKQTIVVLSTLVLFLVFSFCAPKGVQRGEESPRYVFLFIGDGMGIAQVHASEMMQGALAGEKIKIEKLSFSQFPGIGLITTYSSNSYITDSAAAGTAMASGQKTVNGRINMDKANKVEFKTIAEMAKEKGMKVGILSNVALNHATPACFYAHVSHRNFYSQIARQMIESGFDFFGGGGLYLPDQEGLYKDTLELASQKGYQVIQSKKEFLSLGKAAGKGKVMAFNENLTPDAAMAYRIDTEGGDLSLVDYVDKAIELLDNEKGFFMMAEGGEIDWAGHDNDAATLIEEVFDFDKAVLRAVQFYKDHPEDTLILVTADHETGGMALGSFFSGYRQSPELLKGQVISFEKFNDLYIKPYKKEKNKEEWRVDDLIPLIETNFGLKKLSQGDQEELRSAFKESNPALFRFALLKILNQKAGIGWATNAHTACPVPVFAIGRGYESFVGYYDNTDLFHKLVRVMSLSADKN